MKSLKERGIEARKQERARKEQIRDLNARGDLIPVQLMAPIREPDKNPTPYEQATMTAEAYPHLVLVIQQIKSGACDMPIDIDEDNV
jgi:hypothetical protein